MEVLLLTLALVGSAVLMRGPLRRELRHLTPHGRAAAYREAMGVLAGATLTSRSASTTATRPVAPTRSAASTRSAAPSRRAERRRRVARERAALRRRRVRVVLAAGVLAAAAAVPSLGVGALPLLALTGGLLAFHVWLGARLVGASSAREASSTREASQAREASR